MSRLARTEASVDVDTHVHLHDGYDLPALFRRLSRRTAAAGRPLVLLLAEMAGARAFADLMGGARTGVEVAPTEEPESLSVMPEAEGEGVYVVAGRQIVSEEGIEVLALGLEPDHSLAETSGRTRRAHELARGVLAAGAVCVLPWGVGKWLGARGRLVDHLAVEPELAADARFFLGDIPARSWPWPRPAQFDRGVRVLAGTDPLPMAGAEMGIARYRCVLDTELSATRPWASVRDALARARSPVIAGQRDGPLRALTDQVRLRVGRISRGGSRERP